MISIIIPTHNRESTLIDTVNSLLKISDEAAIEIMVVDNNSSDGTAAAIKDLQPRYPGLVRYIHEPRRAASAARNTGAKNASGEVLLFLDDDVRVQPGSLTRIQQIFDEYPDCGMVSAQVAPRFEVTPPEWAQKCQASYNGWSLWYPGNQPHLANGQQETDWAIGAMHAISRQAFDGAGGYPPDIVIIGEEPSSYRLDIGAGDTGLAHFVKRQGFKILYNPLVCGYHLVPASRFTPRFWHARMVSEAHYHVVSKRVFWKMRPSQLLLDRKRVQAEFFKTIRALQHRLEVPPPEGGIYPEEMWLHYYLAYLNLDVIVRQHPSFCDYLDTLSRHGVPEGVDPESFFPDAYRLFVDKFIRSPLPPIQTTHDIDNYLANIDAAIRDECADTEKVLQAVFDCTHEPMEMIRERVTGRRPGGASSIRKATSSLSDTDSAVAWLVALYAEEGNKEALLSIISEPTHQHSKSVQETMLIAGQLGITEGDILSARNYQSDNTQQSSAYPEVSKKNQNSACANLHFTCAIIANCEEYYLAKCHEAFRTGLRNLFGARCFGPGYPEFRDDLHDYPSIIRQMYPESHPNIVMIDYGLEDGKIVFPYKEAKKINAITVILLADFWNLTDANRSRFIDSVIENNVDIIMSYFPHPLSLYKGTPIHNRIIYLPPCFDPAIFNLWNMPKQYDVGFLAAGTTDYSQFYSERFSIHNRLLRQKGIKYLWAEHPGWERKDYFHPLVGKGFSQLINSCKLFITTGGKYKHPNPKYVEIMASGAALMAEEPFDMDALHLKDGENYIKITEDDVIEKIGFYLARPELTEKIAAAGYKTAMRFHSCFARAVDFMDAVSPFLSKGPSLTETSSSRHCSSLLSGRQGIYLDLPLPLLCDDNHEEPISLPGSMTQLPISSAPQYTLYRLVRRLNPLKILEIGTQEGASAVAMALAMQHNGSTPSITCVDPFLPCGDNNGEVTLQAFYRNINAGGFSENIRLLKTMSDIALPSLIDRRERFDLILVDGSHQYRHVKSDLINSLQLVNPGGYIWMHDYIFYESVRSACDEVLNKRKLPFFINDIQRNYRNELCGWAIAKA